MTKGGCMAKGGMHGERGGCGKVGVCVTKEGVPGKGGACMVWPPLYEIRPVNACAVCILLECILVVSRFHIDYVKILLQENGEFIDKRFVSKNREKQLADTISL